MYKVQKGLSTKNGIQKSIQFTCWHCYLLYLRLIKEASGEVFSIYENDVLGVP